MSIRVTLVGASRSFPDGAPDLAGDGQLFLGADAGQAYAEATIDSPFAATELEHDLLARHTGLDEADAHRRTVGFARFRMGDAAPGTLIELVHLPWTDRQAIAAARAAFEGAGFVVASCGDAPGRIVNRLIRPYLNAVLRRLDDGLASEQDMDTTLRLGLGYPEGPNALLTRTGLAAHFDTTQALYIATGDPDLAPARRARIAKERAGS